VHFWKNDLAAYRQFPATNGRGHIAAEVFWLGPLVPDEREGAEETPKDSTGFSHPIWDALSVSPNPRGFRPRGAEAFTPR